MTSRLAPILALLFTAFATRAAAQTPLPLIPYPRTVIRNTGAVELAHRLRLDAPSPTDLRALGAYASDLLQAELGWRPEVVSGPSRPAGLTLRLSLPDSTLGNEGYRLSSQTSGVVIEAPTEAGLFHGLQTFRQLLHPARPGTVPRVEIRDTPRFPYRGMHLDVARHFFPVAFVERYIDLLARYKFNTFHWHLTDDQGWRVEIKAYPKLTEIGSCRRETVVGKNFDPYIGDSTRYCGFYTQDEIRQVVAYAAARHITIIPEIEMPGHSQAAIAAYPELACTPGPFEVSTVWGVDEDILCPSEATFAFLEGVLTEVMALFPGPYIHIGGDEAPKARWKSSDLAQIHHPAGAAGGRARAAELVHPADRAVPERARPAAGRVGRDPRGWPGPRRHRHELARRERRDRRRATGARRDHDARPATPTSTTPRATPRSSPSRSAATCHSRRSTPSSRCRRC